MSRKSKGSAERVKVHCRVRPPSEDELSSVVSSSEYGVVKLNNEEEFRFDSFLDRDVTQAEVYSQVAAPIVSSVMQGYNGTVFAYGQTGSGKTYSMFGGDDASMGIVPRSIAQVFQTVNADETHDYTVSLSYVQIYCEMLTDLFVPTESATSLLIRECHRKGIFIEGAKAVVVQSPEEAMQLVAEGDVRRARAATQMNEASSRSHACMILNISKRGGIEEKKKLVKYGKLILVDLAGSERVKKSLGDSLLNYGTRFMESKAINLSLSALGNCISALAQKKQHVPYRDAKLTRLLKDSLGGNSMTALVLNIAPTHYSETKSTLIFGQRAMDVVTRVSINEEVDFQELYNSVQATVDSKDDRIHVMEIEMRKMQIELNENRKLLESATIEKDMAKMQLATVSISSEQAEQIKHLEDQHQKALQATQKAYEDEAHNEKIKTQIATEEWNKIEYELKDEREEHLRTCVMLREKQEQIVELERSQGERIAELLDELKLSNEAGEKIKTSLDYSTSEKGLLMAKIKSLQEDLVKGKEFQEKGLLLMQTLTGRVEELEKQRSETKLELQFLYDREDDDSSSGKNKLTVGRRNNAISNNPISNARTRKPPLLSQNTLRKQEPSVLRSSAASSILRF